MTEKRFTLGDYNTNIQELYDNDEYLTSIKVDTAEKICKLLNQQYEENIRIKQLITEAYNNERTQIGRNTLKQLLEQV